LVYYTLQQTIHLNNLKNMAYKLRENEDESTDQGFQDSPKQGIQYEKTDVVISGNEDIIKKLTGILQNEEILDLLGRYAISFARANYPNEFIRRYGPSIPPPQLKGLANRIKDKKLSPKDVKSLGFKDEKEVYDYYGENPSFTPKTTTDEMIEFSKNLLNVNKDLFKNIKYKYKISDTKFNKEFYREHIGKTYSKEEFDKISKEGKQRDKVKNSPDYEPTIEIPYKGNIDYITNVIKSIAQNANLSKGDYKISTKTNIKETIRKYVKEAIQRA